jgi:hypothetical protein
MTKRQNRDTNFKNEGANTVFNQRWNGKMCDAV